jgi:hypothetical protein
MVLLSDGTGGLQAALPITLSYAQIAPPVEVLLGNLDGDALPELLVTWGSFLGVRLTNLGGGSFASPVEVDHTGTRSRLADMDGDGRTDLVTLSEPWFLSSVWWQAGDGDGGFETPPALPAGMPIGPTRAADFDGDGDLDLLAWPNPGLQPLHLGIALNDGAAHFAPPSLHDVGVSVKDARVVDMDGDGALDVVTAASSGVRIHPGLGDGTLDAPVLVPLQGTLGVRAADTDGDGLPELIVGASFLPAVLRVYPNLGGLNFGAPTELPLTVPARSFDVGDLDGDGHPDAVVQAGKSVLVCAGTGGSLFAPPVAVTAPGTGIGTDFPLLLADLDGDGDLDMLRRTLDVHTEVWLNDGHGALALTQWEWWEAWETMSVADVNGDGAPDIIGSGVMLGLGGGKFTAPRPGAVPCVDGDLDGDGFPDGAGHGKLFLNRSQ